MHSTTSSSFDDVNGNAKYVESNVYDATPSRHDVAPHGATSILGSNENPSSTAPTIPHSHLPQHPIASPLVNYQPPIPSQYPLPLPPPYYNNPTLYPYQPPTYQILYHPEPPHSMYATPFPHYPRPPQYPSALPPFAEPERTNGPTSKIVEESAWAMASAAATVGSIVGLSAAAAMRWWNGDDWYLFTRNSNTPTASPPAVNARDHFSSGQKESNLISTLDAVETEGREYTNRAMELLRQQLQPDISSFSYNKESLCQLREIHETLISIQGSLDASHANEGDSSIDGSAGPLKARMNTVLSTLESILGIENRHVTFQEPFGTTNAPIIESATESFADAPIVKHATESFAETNEDTMDLVSKPTPTELDSIPGIVPNLRQALIQLVLNNDIPSLTHAQFISGIQLLYLYATNIANHPNVPRYRRIYCENEGYRRNVEPLKGSKELLEAMGFHLGQNAKYWEWLPVTAPNTNLESESDDVVQEMYLKRVGDAASALSVLKTATETADKEALLHSALRAARLDDCSEFAVASDLLMGAHSQSDRWTAALNSSETKFCDADKLPVQSTEAPFVCDTDLVTPEAAKLLSAAPTDADDFQSLVVAQGNKSFIETATDDIISDENERGFVSEVWK